MTCQGHLRFSQCFALKREKRARASKKNTMTFFFSRTLPFYKVKVKKQGQESKKRFKTHIHNIVAAVHHIFLISLIFMSLWDTPSRETDKSRLTYFILGSSAKPLRLERAVRCLTMCLYASVFPEPVSPLETQRDRKTKIRCQSYSRR